MSYTIVHNGRSHVRHLGGSRTLAELLTETEAKAFAMGLLVAVGEQGGLLTLSSPIEQGTTITLRPPNSDDAKMFKC